MAMGSDWVGLIKRTMSARGAAPMASGAQQAAAIQPATLPASQQWKLPATGPNLMRAQAPNPVGRPAGSRMAGTMMGMARMGRGLGK